MTSDKVFLEVTEEEIESIDWDRGFRKKWKSLLIPLWCAFGVLIILFFWGYYGLFAFPYKAGKKLWKQTKGRTTK